MESKLQQAIAYNTVHLPRTTAGLVALQPDARRDPEFRNQLRSELQQILEELHQGATGWFYNAATKALLEAAPEMWERIELTPQNKRWTVIALHIGPRSYLVPMAKLHSCIKMCFYSKPNLEQEASTKYGGTNDDD